MTSSAGTALVVMDMQNDFCVGPGVESRFGGRLDVLSAAITGTVRAVAAARARGTEVVFVRLHGDVAFQGPSWRRRNLLLDKPTKCRAGSWGADFHAVSPEPADRVFTKRACFDAFLSDGFADHLARQGTEHLVFVGLYADVCVDSTARTAFQRGLHVTVLTDCTTSLHLPDETTFRFMRTVYGARTTSHDRPGVWSPPLSEVRTRDQHPTAGYGRGERSRSDGLHGRGGTGDGDPPHRLVGE
ncbi:isochorismatase family cysteine hydrolase [Actinoalloteichus spitiensis]|uniref:isochorismatase family cysteine hydrolase n=2 Tax=Actinoalloteichus TaxID=65496 RepID=UPI00037777CE|nr:isochorismatase family cysteine hydrolase [Actinoalloteichus spitiensis]